MAQKILIVDDDPVIVRLIEALLTDNSYDVITADDGLDALVKIKTENPDLVLLDVNLPEINGYDICYQLRFNDEFKRIPIILLTKRRNELGGKVGQRVNIEYVPKPVNPELLFKTVQKLLP